MSYLAEAYLPAVELKCIGHWVLDSFAFRQVAIASDKQLCTVWVVHTPALGESTDRQTELEIILLHSIPRVYTSP